MNFPANYSLESILNDSSLTPSQTDLYNQLLNNSDASIKNAVDLQQEYLKSILGGSKSSGGGSDVIIGVVVGAVATIALLVAGFFYYRRQTRKIREQDDEAPVTGAREKYAHLNTPTTVSETFVRSGENTPALWEDEALLAVRVPFDAVTRQQLVSQGGFGEVYRGQFRDKPVAIKTLLPAKRKEMAQIKAFLAEIKFVAAMEHKRIVAFIGVAWESLSDVCLITEFMEGGDLRSLLTTFESSQPPRAHGFDGDKVKIALHVAHALTYLHSLQPIVVHRDLKSRNVLLDAEMNAKLTDFGVSRERIDQTMTAGVGSSLWMAPEVMLGDRYDEKADIFSFGVLLSELDTQQLPYADSKHGDGSGRQLTQTAVLQLVSLGRLTISLTESPLFPDIQSLARQCVALDPKDRPTAGEVLHCVHQAWKSSQSRAQGGGGLV